MKQVKCTSQHKDIFLRPAQNGDSNVVLSFLHQFIRLNIMIAPIKWYICCEMKNPINKNIMIDQWLKYQACEPHIMS